MSIRVPEPVRVLSLHVASLIAGAVLLGATSAATGRSRTDRHESVLGFWELRISKDRFSGSVRCRLQARDHHAVFRSDAVGFRFGRKREVGEAAYRLDGGAPRRWRDDLPALVRLGTPIDTGGMANPSEGTVWIPYAPLRRVNVVAISPRDGRRPRQFRLQGLKGLLDAAIAQGCARDGGFLA